MPTIQESIQNIRDRLKDPQPEVLDALTRENPQDRHYAEKWLAYHRRPPRGPSTEPREPREPGSRESRESWTKEPSSGSPRRLERLLSPQFNYFGKAEKTEWELGSILGGERLDKYWTLGRHRPLGILTRHFVKAQWEQLGIWNPEWGFPGRNQQEPGDFADKRRWPWEQAEDDDEGISRQRHEAIVRAVRERRNLCRGRWAPVAPRRHPGPDTSAAEAYSFLTSRPWFIYKLDLEVELTKLERLQHGYGSIIYRGTAIWERDQLWKREGESSQPERYWVRSHSSSPIPGQVECPSRFPRSPSPIPSSPSSPTFSPRTQFARLGPMPDIYSIEGSKKLPMWRMHRGLIERRLREAEGQDAKLPDLWPAPPPLSPRSRLERLGEAPEPEPGPYPGWRLFEWEKMKGEIVADMEQWVREGRYVSAAAAGPGRSAAPSEPDAPEPVSAQDEQPPAKRARLSRPAVAAAAEARTAAPARRGGRGGRRARRSPEPGPETVLPSVETEVAVADASESRAAARRSPSVPTLQQPTPRRGRSKRLG
ncbi:hypothetical protein GGTG_04366 [Gaeumannomyces tritici R3-111a-1]|uniref:Uncharacterized protein n=1 Tax=Gaeumannomyces tritici (strain R3-111a-1) TaxID=644352 RepID=J3NSW7_GAET3|nr:hypothetical protein GGTG_04366 [Gaeumannomyces tritici R3-111a-1]EJT79280.1 hypothetical protein GGTG_04366 [Gaeumannomyces tritici R3-111a-1]